MKNQQQFSPDEEARITRWIDGELDDDAVADLLSAHPGLAEEKKSCPTSFGGLLHSELAPDREKDVPYADFFSHRIRQRILEDDEEEMPSGDESVSLKEEAEYLPLFTRMRWTAGLAFVAMLVGIVGYNLMTSPSAVGSEVVSTYTPDPMVTATTRYDSDAEATVIELDGLAEIPVDHSIAGVFAGSYQPCGDFGTHCSHRSRQRPSAACPRH